MDIPPDAGRTGKPRLRILHNLARSGGTVIGRCLACMEGVALLSEIHPRGTHIFNPLGQAREWFGLPEPRDILKLGEAGPIPFDEAIALIDRRLRERGLRLVLRDWSQLDFMGAPVVADPPGHSLLATALGPRFELLRFATVRHPFDQWLSCRKLPSIAELPAERFMRGCRRFAELARETGFLRYEDFCADPAAAMRRICDALDLPFDPTFHDKQAGWTRITGDSPDYGRGDGVVRRLERRPFDPAELARIQRIPDYHATLELLGYAPVEPRSTRTVAPISGGSDRFPGPGI